MSNERLSPYCGPAPSPATLWSSWNADPWLLLALATLAIVGWRLGRADRAGRASLAGALALAVVVFVSPLCALSVALFSARVAHHVLVIAAIAPLLAMALPAPRGPVGSVGLAAALHAAVLWAWHVPGAYDAAWGSPWRYAAMQVSLLVSAWWLWRAVLSPRVAAGTAMMALLATIMQMGFLGALLVFASRPLYSAHALTTEPFGLTPLTDQQLGGLLMWVPAFLPYAGVALHRAMAVVSRPLAPPAAR